MQKLEIEGGRKISGTILISGSKNATLPILASTILTNKKITIKNIPIVKDVETMAKLLNTIGATVKFNKNSFVSRNVKECIIPPNSFVLASTVEYFKIPKDTLVICLGKSTYARCGIIVNVTPLEPGWEGHVTLEFSNTTPLPAKIYANEGAAQFIFLKGNEEPSITYEKRNGKYMKQTGVTLPKV